MVTALRPAWLAMSTKVTPRSVCGEDAAASWPKIGKGRASDNTSEKVSTSADRQRDFRNFRRDCDKKLSANSRAGSAIHFAGGNSVIASEHGLVGVEAMVPDLAPMRYTAFRLWCFSVLQCPGGSPDARNVSTADYATDFSSCFLICRASAKAEQAR